MRYKKKIEEEHFVNSNFLPGDAFLLVPFPYTCYSALSFIYKKVVEIQIIQIENVHIRIHI